MKSEALKLVRERRARGIIHGDHSHRHRLDPRKVALHLLRQKLHRAPPSQDPEKELMKRHIETLEFAVSNISKYLQQSAVQHAPAISFLDEMIASLQTKPDEVAPVELSQSFVDALLSED